MALRDGMGLPADEERSLTWFRLAAQAGDARAQRQVGAMYVAGKGVKADPVKGYAWLSVAATNGDLGAPEALEAAAARMSDAEIAVAKNEARRLASAQRLTRARLARHD